MKHAPILVLSLLMAGCASDGGDVAGDPTFNPPPPVSRPLPRPQPPAEEPRGDTPAQPAPTFKPVSDDQCGAQALQYLIGKPRTDIPVPLNPGNRRVVCSTCVITQDYRADRQTIVFDSDTGLITSVKCG